MVNTQDAIDVFSFRDALSQWLEEKIQLDAASLAELMIKDGLADLSWWRAQE